MEIYVKVFATLRKKYPDINDLNPLKIEIESGISVSQIIVKLGYALTEIHLILLNGKKLDSETLIEEEESILSLFPPVGGG